MDTDRLKYFCTIYESGSITKAADILGISHSALSKAMSLLQSDLKVELFKAVGRGIEPTEAAQDVYTKSKEILAQLRSLKTPHVKTPEKLKIGAPDVIGHCFAAKIASSIYPETFSMLSLSSGEVEAHILTKAIDFGIGVVPFPHKSIEYLKIAKLRFGVFKRQDSLKNLSLSELPFAGTNAEIRENLLNIRAKDGWPAQLERTVAYDMGSFATSVELVTEGRACVFLPQVFAHNFNKTRKKEFQLEEIEFGKAASAFPVFDIYLIKNIHDEESSAMKKISREIRLLCNA